jgi:hypothetical protein
MIKKEGHDLVELRSQKLLEETDDNRKEIRSLYVVSWQRIEHSTSRKEVWNLTSTSTCSVAFTVTVMNFQQRHL